MELSVDMNVLLLLFSLFIIIIIIFIKIRKGGWTGCFSAGTLYSTCGTSTYEERGGWVPNRYERITGSWLLLRTLRLGRAPPRFSSSLLLQIFVIRGEKKKPQLMHKI